MKTRITIYLANGIYSFRSKQELDPTIWIEPDSPNIFIRLKERIKCREMLGSAWKFTIDPFRDTIEIYCGVSKETHPVRVTIETQEGNDHPKTILNYYIPEREYLSGEEIIIREGEVPITDVHTFKPKKL